MRKSHNLFCEKEIEQWEKASKATAGKLRKGPADLIAGFPSVTTGAIDLFRQSYMHHKNESFNKIPNY